MLQKYKYFGMLRTLSTQYREKDVKDLNKMERNEKKSESFAG